MRDLIKEEYMKQAGDNFSEAEFIEWVERRRIMSGPMSGNDQNSVLAYEKTKNYSVLAPQAIKVLLHCLYFGGGIYG